jgi:hypothetical protein
MDRPQRDVLWQARPSIDWLSQDVDEPPQHRIADGHAQRAVRTPDDFASSKPGRHVHRDGANGVGIEVLLNLENESGRSLCHDLKPFLKRRRLARRKRDVDDRAPNAQHAAKASVKVRHGEAPAQQGMGHERETAVGTTVAAALFMNAARAARDLQEAVKRFEVCWEATPEFAGVNHDRNQVGFVVELYGTHDRRDVVPTAGCKHCIPVLQALLDIADYAVPETWRDALDSVRAHSGLEYARERGGRPDVVVAITLIPRLEGRPDVEAIGPCLSGVTERLSSVGACERSWRPPG